jgi:glycine dehydrogenase subunit 1
MRHDALLTGYNVHPESDRALMLEAVGVREIEDLFAQIPATVRLQRALNLPEPLTEWELEKRFGELAAKNATTRTHLSFLGGGAYEHYIPATVDAMASRGEYLTAYTPYQPEMSQGLLRVLHDFQRMVQALLGLPATNCSVYDGATALAEAAWMACCIKGVDHLAVSEAIWPQYRNVLETYMKGREVSIAWVKSVPATGEVDLDHLRDILLDRNAAAFLVQTPNQFGVIEPLRQISSLCREHVTLSNVSVYPMTLGCLESPGKLGADIVTAEAQSLGIPLAAGGPYMGLIATHEEYEKYLPGRIVGDCIDLKGEPALALIKEEREQHVSRDKATSHICSNQALMALRASVYLSTLGEEGFRKVSGLCAIKAHELADALCRIPGVRLAFSGKFFNEFLLEVPVSPSALLSGLRESGIFGGINVAEWNPETPWRSHLLIAVTELRSRSELARMASAFESVVTELKRNGE